VRREILEHVIPAKAAIQSVSVDYVMCSRINYYVVENRQTGFLGHPK